MFFSAFAEQMSGPMRKRGVKIWDMRHLEIGLGDDRLRRGDQHRQGRRNDVAVVGCGGVGMAMSHLATPTR